MEEVIARIWISQLSIENYKSISRAKIFFKPTLNVIIGKNGAGKSNLLEFLAYNSRISQLFRRKSSRLSYSNYQIEYTMVDKQNAVKRLVIEHERKLIEKQEKLNPTNIVSIQRWIDNDLDFRNEFTYQDRSTAKIEPEEREAREFVVKNLSFLRDLNFVFIRFNIPIDHQLAWLENPAKLEYDIEHGPNIDYSDLDFLMRYEFQLEQLLIKEIGNSKLENLDGLKLRLQEHFYEHSHRVKIITSIRSYTPISDIRLNPNLNIYIQDSKIILENLIIDFQVNDFWIPWNYLSDGTKRLFHLIMESIYADNGIILIEEPELGIHPSQLYQVMEYIRKKSHANQIFLTTHSPLVLDVLTPTELENINVAKMSRDGSKFYKLTEKKIEKAKKYMTETGDLSHYWLHSDLEDDD